MERRLGRGLGALLSPEPRLTEPRPAEPRSEIPLAKIRPNPFQPRKTFSPAELGELQNSIAIHGVLQPVIVRPAPDGYELIAGERRYRATEALGRKTIPAIIRDGISDQAMLQLALVENLQRADLDPLEKARGFQQLADQGLAQDEVARVVGLQRSTVANFLRLLELSESIQKVVSQGLISMGHARALLGLTDRRRQDELCALTVRRGLSVREVEARVRELQGREKRAIEASRTANSPPPPWVRDMEARMRTHLGTRVQVRNREGYQGEIVLEYHGREDLERLYALLAPKKVV
jgi:ParB family chromosome partitioning protein